MVRGIDLFADHFSAFQDHYVLIGGTACEQVMRLAGEEFRATKDLDVVLCVESISSDFLRTFWQFIHAGGYSTVQQSTGIHRFYRFISPADHAYPFMIELFSRIPDSLDFSGIGTITPIPADDGGSSLSAILLDSDYYPLISEGRIQIENLSLLSAEYLILFKMRAWIDLSNRRVSGEQIDSRSISKHRSDILRLFRIADPTRSPQTLPESVQQDIREFLNRALDDSISLKQFGYRAITIDSLKQEVALFYRID